MFIQSNEKHLSVPWAINLPSALVMMMMIYIYQNKNKHFKLLFQKESNLNVIKTPQNKKKKKLMANISSHDEGAARAPPLLLERDYGRVARVVSSSLSRVSSSITIVS